jgi:hypothetical protein
MHWYEKEFTYLQAHDEPTLHHTTQPTRSKQLWAFKPIALAVAQDRASDQIVSRRLVELGLALSKMTALRCFQIHHAVSITSVDVPFLPQSARGRLDSGHRPLHEVVLLIRWSGRGADPQQDFIPYCSGKGATCVRRCCMVSSDWLHSGQRGGCCSPCRASLSPVQQRSLQAKPDEELNPWGHSGARVKLPRSWYDGPFKEESVATFGWILRVGRPKPKDGVWPCHELYITHSDPELYVLP